MGLWLTAISIRRYIDRYNRFETIDVMKAADRHLKNTNSLNANEEEADKVTSDVPFPVIGVCMHSPHSRQKRNAIKWCTAVTPNWAFRTQLCTQMRCTYKGLI